MKYLFSAGGIYMYVPFHDKDFKVDVIISIFGKLRQYANRQGLRRLSHKGRQPNHQRTAPGVLLQQGASLTRKLFLIVDFIGETCLSARSAPAIYGNKIHLQMKRKSRVGVEHS